MKLNIVPARQGLLWVRLGVRTFFRQPLGMTGLFFILIALMSLTSLVPLAGIVLVLILLPAGTLGVMAATRVAAEGRFPMPSLLLTAFRAGPARTRAMLTLGVLYSIGFLSVMGISALVDGGKFARLYLLGGKLTREMAMAGDFQAAMWTSMLLSLPLSLLFWHAPALVHWQGISPPKALFFSGVACLRNVLAFTVFGLAWTGIFIFGSMVLLPIVVALGGGASPASLEIPMSVFMAGVLFMFFTSLYFTYRDSFVIPTEETAHEPT